MDTKLKDDEIRSFHLLKDIMLFFLTQMNNDIWIRTYTQELSVLPVENNPLYLKQIKKELQLMPDTSDDAVSETMEGLKMALRFPYKGKVSTFLCRQTALKSLCDRAGISGKTLTNYRSKPSQAALSPDSRAAILSSCLSVYSNRSLVLIRDGKVSAVLSGDDRDYKILPMHDVLMETLHFLKEEFPTHLFLKGYASHEMNLLLFDLNSADLTDEIVRLLHLEGQQVKAKLMITSSDIGTSGANIYPIISVNGVDMVFGKPKRLAHKHAASVNGYRKNLNCILALFRDALSRLESMKAVTIQYPADCLRVIAKELRLSKKHSMIVADKMSKTLTICSAYDIYFYLSEIIRLYLDGLAETPLLQITQIQESIAEYLYMDVQNYDYPFSWE